MIYAGFARSLITPETGLLLGGYRLRRDGATGTHDDLYATCAVIRFGDQEIAFISLDLLCLPHGIVKKIKSNIFTETGINPCKTVVACTHTHSGPGTLGLSGKNENNQNYLDGIPQQISALVREAIEEISAVEVYILQAKVPDVAFNRRIILKDGSTAINIDRVNPSEIQTLGVVDSVATAIIFENDSVVKGVIANFSLHPTTMGETNFQYSRDYPGYLVDRMRENLPGHPIVLFFNGAFGNINQIKNPGNWISTFEEAKRLGDTIAEKLLEVYPSKTQLEVQNLKIAQLIVSIPRRPAKAPGVSEFGMYEIFDKNPEQPAAGLPHHTPEKEALFRDEICELSDSDVEPVELQVVRIGEVEIIAIPGEFFVEWGLDIKSKSQSQYPLVFGNANGYIGYVPLESSFMEGGYETRHSLTSRLIPGAGKVILSNIDQMRKFL